MKVSRNWLNRFVDTSHKSVQELNDAFNELGLVVEGVEQVGQGLNGIVTAQVRTIRAHPQADKIRLVDVVTSPDQTETLQICCGAWNFHEGDIVPLATLGTTMPDGMAIEKRKLRGEWSNGMLCSGRELKISDDHEGIMRLPADTKLGQPIADVLGLVPDAVFDLSIEANRPDAMSILGVARDLAPKIGSTLKVPECSVDVSKVPASTSPRGSISAPDLCDRLTTTIIRNVRVTESPTWVKAAVQSAGMRPINNLVDASNLVMLELGAPSHAFDLDRLAGGRIDVRWGTPDEKVTTLDGNERVVSPTSVANAIDGVIADGNGAPVGVAAIMGGLTSEVEEGTTALLLEIAHWSPMAIARSSKRMGLRSEASARFERGSDPGVIVPTINRFIEVVRETCPELVVESFDDYGPNKGERREVTLRTDRANRLLGTSLTQQQMADLLNPIGFTCTAVPVIAGATAGAPGGESMTVSIPSWRPDATAEVDVIEEVGRHFGYGNIERRVLTNVRVGTLTDAQKARRLIADVLVGNRCDEVWTASFLAPADLVKAGIDDDPVGPPVVLTNPLAAEESVLRPSLLPGMLAVLSHNANHRNPAMRIFELGHTFQKPMPNQVVPYERDMLGIALALDGDDAQTAMRALDSLVEALRINPAAVAVREKPVMGLHPTRSGRIVGSGTGFNIGMIGEVDPEVCRRFGIDRRVGFLMLDVENFCALPKQEDLIESFSRFPSSDVDLAFVVPENVPAADVGTALTAAGGTTLQSVKLFDVYRGERVASGSRGLTYRLRFAHPDKTLTDADVADARAACIAAVEKATGATLRA